MVSRPQNLELPFYRDTPPMCPNLERFGITITHVQGASQTAPIDYISSHYHLVEVIRPKIEKFSKP